MPNRASVPHEFQPGEALTAASLNNVQGAILGELDDTKAATQQSIEQVRVNTDASISNLGQQTTAKINDLSKSVDTRFGDSNKVQAGLDQRVGGVEGRAGKLETRAGTLETRAGNLEGRAGTLEGRAGNLEGRAGTLETRVTNAETAAGNLGKRADGLEARIGGLEGRSGQLENARNDLTNRLVNLEKGDLLNRMGRLESNVPAFAARLDDLDRRLRDVDAARQDLANRLAKLEQRPPVNLVPIMAQRPGGVNVPVLNFDGKAGHVTVPPFAFGGAFTVEAWIYARSPRTWSRIADFGNGPAQNNFILCFQGNEGRLQLETHGINVSNGAVVSDRPIPLNQWVHVAGTVDPGGTGIVYMNGEIVGRGRVGPAVSCNRTINYIGCSNWVADQFLDSFICGVSLWNVARDPGQIKRDVYSPPVGNEPGLLLYYAMNEGGGNTVQDRSPNARHGALNSASWAGMSQPGPLIATQGFATRGGSGLLFVSGSAWSTTGAQQIGMQVLVDGQVRGYAKSFTNEGGSHKAFVSGAIPLNNLPGGNHVLTLETWNTTTRVDGNDFFDASLIELPS